MASPNVSASVGLYNSAEGLRGKSPFARAAEKYGRAAAAAAQELAAEDCLVVAYLRAEQAKALLCHSLAVSWNADEAVGALQTIKSVLLPQCVPTVTRRTAAGTLLPGSCRAAEVAWWRTSIERNPHQGSTSTEDLRACAAACAPTLGIEAFMLTAHVAADVLFIMGDSDTREMQLSNAAFVASAFELMAQPRKLPSIVVDGVDTVVLPSPQEQGLAQNAHKMLLYGRGSKLDREALSLMADAWQRVERSGVIAVRMLLDNDSTTDVNAGVAEAAAEGAVRGLHKCALAGCAAKEVHVSQFKRCGACRTVSYCCREHQLADWPSHKAACKAARNSRAA